MRHLLPKPAERLALRIAHRLRHYWRRIARPQLRGVSVLLRDGQGRVLMVRHAYGPPQWSPPGGGIARGEPPEDAARREMEEELGLRIERLVLLGTLSETISGAPHTAYLFTAQIDALPRPDGREVVEARFFALDGLPPEMSALTRRRLAILAES
ncbi:NUDIX domain-containing protein [Citromicrobium bathyomarinum]|uniref:NUDIX hydrolase n=1 Tax=Citromicrobium bathyomarinum TaxID=72174 RepID=UPI00315AAF42